MLKKQNIFKNYKYLNKYKKQKYFKTDKWE